MELYIILISVAYRHNIYTSTAPNLISRGHYHNEVVCLTQVKGHANIDQRRSRNNLIYATESDQYFP